MSSISKVGYKANTRDSGTNLTCSLNQTLGQITDSQMVSVQLVVRPAMALKENVSEHVSVLLLIFISILSVILMLLLLTLTRLRMSRRITRNQETPQAVWLVTNQENSKEFQQYETLHSSLGDIYHKIGEEKRCVATLCTKSQTSQEVGICPTHPNRNGSVCILADLDRMNQTMLLYHPCPEGTCLNCLNVSHTMQRLPQQNPTNMSNTCPRSRSSKSCCTLPRSRDLSQPENLLSEVERQ